MHRVVSPASLAIKSNYSKRSFSGVFGKSEIKANASVTRDFSPSRCKDNEKSVNESNFRKKFAKKVAYLTKKQYICNRKQEDSRIRQSESSDNRTRRHPVDLLAGHLFYI